MPWDTRSRRKNAQSHSSRSVHLEVAPDQASSPAPPRPQSTWRDLLQRLRVKQLSAPRRVLFVEAERELGNHFRRCAQGSGAVVDVATDAVEAFSRCVEFAYDVVVLQTSNGLAERLLDSVRALQTSASVILLRDSSKLLNVAPPDDPGVVGMLSNPWDKAQVRALLDRAFALADTRLEWNSAVRTVLPTNVRVLYVGPSARQAVIQEQLQLAPNASAIVLRGVRSLAEANAVLEHTPIDVVIAALTLPDARGLDAVVNFSEGPKAKPLIVVSDDRDPALVIQALRYGAHEVLTYEALERLTESLTQAIDRHRATVRVSHMAHHDALTGLPNRTLFEQRLRASLSRATRKREQLAVLYVDLDKFKPINDLHGHDAGDRVLQAVAKRILTTIRDYDTAARLGGDEFAILLNSLEHPDEAQTVASRIQAALCQPVDIGAQEVTLGCSIGIAVFPGPSSCPETLLQEADKAMYRAKRAGRDSVAPRRPHLRLVQGGKVRDDR